MFRTQNGSRNMPNIFDFAKINISRTLLMTEFRMKEDDDGGSSGDDDDEFMMVMVAVLPPWPKKTYIFAET